MSPENEVVSNAPIPTQPSIPSMGRWVAVLIVCIVIAIAVPIGYSTWITVTYARHSCQALEVLTQKPVPKPTDPSANPSREQGYELYLGLKYWEREDGCSP